MAFELPALPYAQDALAPTISAETMEYHYGKHHQTYVDNLNKAVAGTADENASLEDIIMKAEGPLFNNAAQVWNHTFFWQSMTRPGQGGAPSAALQAAITRDFGSLDAFKAAFKTTGLGRFGSGWAWLIVGSDGKLKITSTPNQDNPLMDVAPDRGTPLLGNDVWEHAYYLQYQNRRGDYLDAWWQIVDWNVISARYAAATSTAR